MCSNIWFDVCCFKLPIGSHIALIFYVYFSSSGPQFAEEPSPAPIPTSPFGDYRQYQWEGRTPLFYPLDLFKFLAEDKKKRWRCRLSSCFSVKNYPLSWPHDLLQGAKDGTHLHFFLLWDIQICLLPFCHWLILSFFPCICVARNSVGVKAVYLWRWDALSALVWHAYPYKRAVMVLNLRKHITHET